MNKKNFLGYAIDSSTQIECIAQILEHIRSKRAAKWMACLNPHSYVVSKSDPIFSNALHSADWVIPDGIGIILASKILGGDLNARLTGSDIFAGLSSEMNKSKEFSVFFLGSTNRVLDLLIKKMSVEFPNIRIAGTYSPPFLTKYSLSEIDHMISVINKVNPDVLWVAMTAPKQEKWVAENIHKFSKVSFIGAVGAVFDFYAGTVKRSNTYFQKFGFEWLPRLLKQPTRLWKRTLISAPIFVYYIIKEKLKK